MSRKAGPPIVAFLIVLAVASAPVWAQSPLKIGKVLPYQAESPHPYPLGTEARPVVWTDRVISPGAEFIRVHFSRLDLAPGDSVTVSSPDGRQSWSYTGRGPHGDGDVWAFAIDGDTAIIRIHGGRGAGHGYVIDAVGHGTISLVGKSSEPVPEVVCGLDGREDVACHPTINSDPVARLQWIQGAFIFSCTGWLARGSSPSLMVTNNHCFSTQKVTNNVQATFRFQHATCGGTDSPTGTSFGGGTFLRTNNVSQKGNKGGLDYTLFTLLGNPEATFGEYIPTTAAASVGDPIWFIQHPGGGFKEIGFYEDTVGGQVCKVDTINATYAKSAPGSQTGYQCDSEGGASGSPILSATSGKVIALHHFGGVPDPGFACLNSGTRMAAICADAGGLLICD